MFKMYYSESPHIAPTVNKSSPPVTIAALETVQVVRDNWLLKLVCKPTVTNKEANKETKNSAKKREANKLPKKSAS